jgi:hypothetical protein
MIRGESALAGERAHHAIAGRSCLACIVATASDQAAPSCGLDICRIAYPPSPPPPRAVAEAACSHGEPESHDPARHRPPQELVIFDKLVTCRLILAAVVEHAIWDEDSPRQHPDGQPVCLEARRRQSSHPAREQRQPEAEDAQEGRRATTPQQVGRGQALPCCHNASPGRQLTLCSNSGRSSPTLTACARISRARSVTACCTSLTRYRAGTHTAIQ